MMIYRTFEHFAFLTEAELKARHESEKNAGDYSLPLDHWLEVKGAIEVEAVSNCDVLKVGHWEERAIVENHELSTELLETPAFVRRQATEGGEFAQGEPIILWVQRKTANSERNFRDFDVFVRRDND